MNTAILLLVAFVQLLHQHVFCQDYEAATVLCLHQEMENSNNYCQSCTRNCTDIKTITMPSGNFVIQFCSDEFNLTSELVISDKIAVNVTGHRSKIVCNPSRQGILIFNNVTGLRIQGISLHSCGASLSPQLHSLGEDTLFFTSIFVVSCTDVTISDLTVNDSFGNGLTMIDNDRKVKLICLRSSA